MEYLFFLLGAVIAVAKMTASTTRGHNLLAPYMKQRISAVTYVKFYRTEQTFSKFKIYPGDKLSELSDYEVHGHTLYV